MWHAHVRLVSDDGLRIDHKHGRLDAEVEIGELGEDERVGERKTSLMGEALQPAHRQAQRSVACQHRDVSNLLAMQDARVLSAIARCDGGWAPQLPRCKVLLAVLATDGQSSVFYKRGDVPAVFNQACTTWLVLWCCVRNRPHIESIELILKVCTIFGCNIARFTPYSVTLDQLTGPSAFLTRKRCREGDGRPESDCAISLRKELMLGKKAAERTYGRWNLHVLQDLGANDDG